MKSSIVFAQKNIALEKMTPEELKQRTVYFGKILEQDEEYQFSKQPEFEKYLSMYALTKSEDPILEAYLYLYDEDIPLQYQASIKESKWEIIPRGKNEVPFSDYFERHAQSKNKKL